MQREPRKGSIPCCRSIPHNGKAMNPGMCQIDPTAAAINVPLQASSCAKCFKITCRGIAYRTIETKPAHKESWNDSAKSFHPNANALQSPARIDDKGKCE